MTKEHIYLSIIDMIFHSKFKPGMREVDFGREDINHFASQSNIALPKNLGDLIYSFRYRAALPESIKKTAKKGEAWIIRPAGRSKYRFALVPDLPLSPNKNVVITKIPDSTPGVVAKYAFNDEQALLAKVRYNRLVDVFLGITCYSLQNHLRTTVPEIGQVETDEIYVGIDKRGVHYVVPIQAKGGTDKLSIVQIEQDFAVCANKFPSLLCRAVGAQFMEDHVIALFELEQTEQGIGMVSEKHYKLVPPNQVNEADLEAYRSRLT